MLVHSDLVLSTTRWLPIDNEINNLFTFQRWVIVGVECTTDWAQTSTLESTTLPDAQQYGQYRCACRGTRNNAPTQGNKNCWIYVWQCPRIS